MPFYMESISCSGFLDVNELFEDQQVINSDKKSYLRIQYFCMACLCNYRLLSVRLPILLLFSLYEKKLVIGISFDYLMGYLGIDANVFFPPRI